MLPHCYRYVLSLVLLSVLMGGGTLSAEVIEKDTVWSGDIYINEKVVVDEGATLLITPGSRITFEPLPTESLKGGGRLIIFGRLIAQGSVDSPVVFTSAANTPRMGDWEGLRFEQSNQQFSRLDFCNIEHARVGINGRSSYLQIENSHLRHNRVGLVARSLLQGGLFNCSVSGNNLGVQFEQNDHLRIVNCRIEKNVNGGVVYSNSSPIIQYSTIVDNGEQGIACLRGSSPLIEDNLIRDHQFGVRAEMSSSPTILHNEIVANETAISLERLSFAVIENNRLAGNDIGIFCNLGAYPHIHGNSIVDSRRLAVDLGTYQSIVVAKETPFDARKALNLTVPDQAQDTSLIRNEVVSAFPRVGIVDAYGNWWGEPSLKSLRAGGLNKEFFEDGRDTATLDYRGRTYPRDCIGFSGWLDREPEQAKRRTMKFSGVKGQVTHNGEPVADVRVYVYRDAEESISGEGVTFSSPTGVDGRYSLQLKPGQYTLVARNSLPKVIFQAPDSSNNLELVSVATVSVDIDNSQELNFQMK